MRNPRSAKLLGTRHDRNYFKRRNRWQKALLSAGVLVAVVTVGWLGMSAARRDEAPFSGGPMSRSHAFFADQCSTCHTEAPGLQSTGFKKNATDAACLACHQAPAHQPNQTFAPSCGSCHVEHTGALRLAQTSDDTCAQCHSDLAVRSGALRVVKSVSHFNDAHPEFTARDDGAIAFNHSVHLKQEGILGPNGRTNLQCSDCHRVPAEIPQTKWRFAQAGLTVGPTPSSTDLRAHQRDRAYMGPITYERNCAGCHALEFDRRLSNQVPHDTPAKIHEYLLFRYTEAARTDPAILNYAEPERRKLPLANFAPSSSQAGTIQAAVFRAEQFLWRKTCRECHQLANLPENPGQPLPAVTPARIRERWFDMALFSHDAHESFHCESCHTAVLASAKTSDVLLPSIDTCRSCHNAGEGRSKVIMKTGSAENGCFLCHEYHDWNQRKPKQGSADVASAHLFAIP